MVCTLPQIFNPSTNFAIDYFKRQKSKDIPVQAWKGPEGTRRLMLPDCKKIGTRRR